ncbi:ATP synthase F1 subunit gamma [Mycoplasmopsis lipofaciens]|uniref:ATP synthase F1 subunit gamma n=1 Tax=Mycoplasmopsis lipofaciens TaxID=114884 RepID=UPI000480F2C5|nr:ATP synthase F1 subunit gamma [Mycoplasmopsis lipofaciens]
MAGLQAIKNRIGAVNSIRKITHAMELVAASKLRKARAEYENVTSYDNLLEETFESILSHLTHSEITRLFPDNHVQSKLYIILTSDLGLAGSYNFNVIKLAKNTIKKEDKLILVGVKAINALTEKYKDQILMSMNIDSEESHQAIAKDLAKVVYHQYRHNHVGSIHVIYNLFINNLVQQETITQIFPFNLLEMEKHNILHKQTSINSPVEFEPSAHVVLGESIPLYINSKVYKTLASSKLSEMASRRSAMETATDNANSLIKDLNLSYNRRRQSNITQELNEIVAGADAV